MSAFVRANYRRELAASCLLPVALAAVEGPVAAVIVKNAYSGRVDGAWLAMTVGLVGSVNELANLSSFAWAAVAHGRRKVRIIVPLLAVAVGMVALVAAAPRTGRGLVLMVGAVLAARVCLAGVFTLRATVWGANYERVARTRATARFAMLSTVVIGGSALLIARGRDVSQQVFSGLLLGSCAVGMFGVAAYSGIRVRRHRRLVRAEREAAVRPSLNPASLWRVLREDGDYAWFMAAMFTLGTGNLMLTAPLTLTLADQFGLSAMGSMVITSSLPYMIIPLVIPFWTGMLAHRHVVRFRVFHSWVFVAAQAMVLLAAATNRLPLMYGASAFLGVAMAGGQLAWHLGHLDFAPPHRASQYMGVHVTLNGVRGVLAPILAVGLFRWLRAWRPGAEHWVFAFSVVLCAAGAVGFALLAKRMGARAGRDVAR
jgi:hypothetical protein